MTQDSTELTVYELLMRTARMMDGDAIPATRASAREMVRRFERTRKPVISRADHARYTDVLIAAVGGDPFVAEQFEVLTDYLTSLVLPGLEDLRLVDNESGNTILPGEEIQHFSEGTAAELGPVTFLGIVVARTGRVLVEVEDSRGVGLFASYRLSAHVVGRDGKQVHRVDLGG